MRHEEAVALLRGGVSGSGGAWADLGAGSGTFTRALAELLGPDGTVHALDRDARAIVSRAERPGLARIEPRQGDFTRPLPFRDLDGILMANALHFVADHEPVLRQVLEAVRDGGVFLLVEYDLERGTPWIPHPISRTRFDELAGAVGLRDVGEVGRTPSRYGARDIYAAAGVKSAQGR